MGSKKNNKKSGGFNSGGVVASKRATPIVREEVPVAVEEAAVAVAVEEAPATVVEAVPAAVAKKGGKPRSKVVTGTNTWRDGFTESVVKKWEDWACVGSTDPKGLSFVAKVRAAVAEGKITCDIADDTMLAEMCCTAWKDGGKGMNEAKLIKMVPLFMA